MKVERSDIEFPLWRKKVDSVLLDRLHTPLPNWVAKLWSIEDMVGKNSSKKDVESAVKIIFEKKQYLGWVTYAKYQKKDTNYKLFISNEFSNRLKDVFVMSYMRSLEIKLRKANLIHVGNVEEEIPFWEFLDIEFDRKNKLFTCKAHYCHKPIFPELFKQFVKSHLLKEIENKLSAKGDFKFIKEDWQSRKHAKALLERKNIIYYLIDTKNKLFYIGEGECSKRILHPRSELPDWDFFRIECLPEWLSRSERQELERLLIRSYASVLNNHKGIPTRLISEFHLVNKKIDK